MTRWSTLPDVDVVEDKVFEGHHVRDVRNGMVLNRRQKLRLERPVRE